MWNPVGPGDLDYTAVWGRGPDDVFVAGRGGGLEHTRDRGKTWQPLNGLGLANPYTISGDASVLVIGGDTGQVHFGGGAARLGPTAPGESGLAPPPHQQPDNRGVIFRSADDGRTFSADRTGTGIVLGIASAGSEMVAVTCGKAAVKSTAQQLGKTISGYAPFLRSTDRGKSWVPDRFSFNVTVTKGAMAPPPRDWICGAHGVVHVPGGFVAYGRGGAIFAERHGHKWSRLPALHGVLHAMWWDEKHALYAALDREILRSTDLAKTWTKVSDQGSIAGFWSSSPDNLYAVGGDAHALILHSTDGGTTWKAETIASPPPGATWGASNPVAIWGANEHEVYVVGPNGMLLKRKPQ